MGFPTKNQKEILETFEKNLIVSASAGSGKTTVMVQKIFDLITIQNQPVDSLLVVTFTNLAATEMKQRLLVKLSESLAIETDANKLQFLMKQYENIDNAYICTIDKFCLDIVKKYFYVLKIEPNFSLLSVNEEIKLKARSFELCLEKYLETNEDLVNKLLLLFTENRSLEQLKGIIFRLYEIMQVQENKDDYINNTVYGLYSLPLKENTVFKMRIARLRECLNDVKIGFNNELDAICDNANNMQKVQQDIDTLSALLMYDDEKLYSTIFNTEIKSPTSRTPSLVGIRKYYNKVKDEINQFKTFFCNCNLKQLEISISETKGILKNLLEFTFEFEKYYNNLKKQKRVYSFSDIELMAKEILLDEIINKDVKNKINYIFVDEYQDVNPLQQSLIDTIKKDNNLFIVGDVKQSIYGFRFSEPKLLIKKMDNAQFNDLDCLKNLNENFRSDNRILSFVNDIFNKIMLKEYSGIDYKNGHALVGDKEYLNELPVVKVAVIEKSEEECVEFDEIYSLKNHISSKENNKDLEAIEVCKCVEECLKGKIFDSSLNDGQGGLRPVQFRDIAILFRSKKELFKSVAGNLKDANVPINMEYSGDIFDNFAVKLINSFLSLLINAKDDISLVTILRGVSFGLDDEELSEIKIMYPDEKCFYEAINKYLIKNKDEITRKVNHIYSFLETLKQNMYTSSVYDLILQIENFCSLTSFIKTMPNAVAVLDSYKKFISEIKKMDFSSIVEYLIYLEDRQSIQDTISFKSDENSIMLTTIHGSKGLEYPIVILCGTNTNLQPFRDKVIANEMGIGIDYYNISDRWRYPSAIKNYLKLLNYEKEIEEEKRLLYVALTRAKYNLYIVGTASAKQILGESNSKTYLSYILDTLSPIQRNNLYQDKKMINGNVEFEIVTDLEMKETESKITMFSTLNDDLANKIYGFLAYEYPYLEATNISSKNTVTGLIKKENQDIHYVETKKDFYNTSLINIDKTEVGTFYHKILEELNFNHDFSKEYIVQFVDYLKEKENIKFDVDYDSIYSAYLNIKAIGSDVKYLKEQPFVLQVPYNKIDNESNCDDFVYIQGVIDLIILRGNSAIIVDYKNTMTKNPQTIKERYEKQLEIYKLATQQALNVNVSECYVYSILGKTFVKMC